MAGANDALESFEFAVEPGDDVAYDRTLDGEPAGCGTLAVSADDPAEEIALTIAAFLASRRGK